MRLLGDVSKGSRVLGKGRLFRICYIPTQFGNFQIEYVLILILVSSTYFKRSRIIEHDFHISAKHLALSGCRTAYPTLEVAKQAVQPMITGNDDDIESFDPNEVMAKAYMAKKPDDDPKVSSKSQGGPLAFLGLQKTTTTTGDIPEKKIIEDKSVDGWSTEPKSKNVEKEIAQSRAEKKIIEDKSVDGWTQDSNSENVEKEATKENEKKKDETSSDEGCAKDANSKNDGNEITTATDKTEKKIWLNSNLFTQEKKDNASTEGGREEMEQDDNNTENDKNNVMET